MHGARPSGDGVAPVRDDPPASTGVHEIAHGGSERVAAAHAGGDKIASRVHVDEGGAPAGEGGTPDGEDCAPDEGKQKRRKWEDAHDVKLLKAARAANAHVAPRGKIAERFEKAAVIFNSQPQAPFSVTGKVIQDRFGTLRKLDTTQDNAERSKTGYEKESDDTELEVLLRDVMPKSIELRQREANERNEASEREEKLVADGATIRQLAMERRRKRSKDAEEGNNDEATDTHSTCESMATKNLAKKSRRRMHKELEEDDNDIIEVIQQSEKRRQEQANRQMALEERRLDEERQYRREEAARRERQDVAQREEREAFMRVLHAMARKLG